MNETLRTAIGVAIWLGYCAGLWWLATHPEMPVCLSGDGGDAMTVTLPVEWHRDRDGGDVLIVGPALIGGVMISDRFDSYNKYRVAFDSNTFMGYYPTREAAMAALEEAGRALGAKVE